MANLALSFITFNFVTSNLCAFRGVKKPENLWRKTISEKLDVNRQSPFKLKKKIRLLCLFVCFYPVENNFGETRFRLNMIFQAVSF